MRLSDPKAIRALAHPSRLDLLETLGEIGPATAASCGRTLGVSQASCSFRLRPSSARPPVRSTARAARSARAPSGGTWPGAWPPPFG
ncbi:helix-turn-helix domain-containing protein [Streptomyces sp. NBC_01260]|nr:MULTISPECIES: helix-turn-helix domain-containing protein [unclassified Streptomyces]MCX4774555.1 helix-turn-helix domain-containing protein [Streptomyces sp. NBC_01285]